MTHSEISAPIRRMAKPLNFPEKMLLRLPEGTMDRIRAVMGDADMATLVREALERELKRRERSQTKAAGRD